MVLMSALDIASEAHINPGEEGASNFSAQIMSNYWFFLQNVILLEGTLLSAVLLKRGKSPEIPQQEMSVDLRDRCFIGK